MILKQKLAYMALGALIASIGYFIGTMNNLNAEDEVARVKKLIVSESITVGDENSEDHVFINNNIVHVSDENLNKLILSPDEIVFMDMESVAQLLQIMGDPKRDFRDLEYLKRTNRKLETVSKLTLSLKDLLPKIEMRLPNGKKITLSINKQAEIKLSNGGLKSKTVAVD